MCLVLRQNNNRHLPEGPGLSTFVSGEKEGGGVIWIGTRLGIISHGVISEICVWVFPFSLSFLLLFLTGLGTCRVMSGQHFVSASSVH